jgi:tRNA nucleotidyltransferase (CCA-adding enzyme)
VSESSQREPQNKDRGMQVILTHENADFDAIASLLAAHKLYTRAIPVLPHRINRNVRAFLSLYGSRFSLVDRDTLDRHLSIDRVILVDTQKLTYVRGMSKEVNQVLVIDHHTPPKSPPDNWRYQCKTLGAATTLLIEALSTRLIPISPIEATLMLAGIYEDTGGLTYASTTPRDMRAAAWLVDQGANLELAIEFLDHPLSETQLAIYQKLHENLETLEVDRHPIVMSWARSPGGRDEEVSTLAHKLNNLLEPSALFIFVQIAGNTQMVARSATNDINVAEVARYLGGDGHDRAAAALIHDRPAEEVYEELLDILPRYVQPRIKVRDLMSYGVQTVSPDDAIADLAEKMLHTGHEGFPVIDEDGNVCGLVTRNAVDRAIQHELGRHPISRIMKQGEVSVSPEDSAERLRSLMIQTGWGQIPVVEDDQIIGVVTRTDMIRIPPSSQTLQRKRITHLMEQAIPRPVLTLIHKMGERAANADDMLYFVGGIVRDLLLGQDIVDIDLVVEGDAIRLGRAMEAHYGGEIRSHRRFGTVKWILPDDIWKQVSQESGGNESWRAPPLPSGQTHKESNLPEFIDLVTARTEFYEHPTALPMVSRSSIKQDLHRRDFTINTMAIRLDPQRWGELLDFYGGQSDLRKGVIRVLHSLSFVDDPTRVLRAARFEARLGFQLDQRSASLIEDALPLLERITGERIRHEFDLIFQEDKPERALDRLQEFGVLQTLQPNLKSDAWLHERFRRLRTVFNAEQWQLSEEDSRFLYWSIFLYRLDNPSFEAIRDRLRLWSRLVDAHMWARKGQDIIVPLKQAEKPSDIVMLLEPYSLEVLAILWLITNDGEVRATLEQYADAWYRVEPKLNGNDLKDMGLEPGPRFRTILTALKGAKLNGEVTTREEERDYVIEHFNPSEPGES